MEFSFIIDAFTEKRGEPKMFALYCANCNSYLFTYQKDGPGPLLRCYLDRIHSSFNIETELCSCSICNAQIGKKGIYEKENRLAFFLVLDSFFTKELTDTDCN